MMSDEVLKIKREKKLRTKKYGFKLYMIVTIKKRKRKSEDYNICRFECYITVRRCALLEMEGPV